MEGNRLSQRPAASSDFLGGRLADVAPAEQARGVGPQPQVDALHVEQVPAQRQQPHRLSVPHHGEADRALRPPGAGAAPPVRELGNRRERGRRKPHRILPLPEAAFAPAAAPAAYPLAKARRKQMATVRTMRPEAQARQTRTTVSHTL
ncbi:unnamed protein product [Urochloa humidicola]